MGGQHRPGNPRDPNPAVPVERTAFSPDGKLLACAGSNGTLRVRDTATGKELYRAPLPTRETQTIVNGKVTSKTKVLALGDLSFSADSRTILTASPEALVMLDAATGKEIRRIKHVEASWPYARLIPDGQNLVYSYSSATANLQGIVLVDAHTGHEMCGFRGVKKAVDAVAIAPDGRSIVAAERWGLRVWGGRQRPDAV